MATITVENYLKRILTLSLDDETKPVPMGKIAKRMKVVPGTATTMIKSLHQSGLVDYQSRKGVKLTKSGRKLAVRVLRKHRIVEMFLVEVLHLDWAEIHEEAELLEHAVSDKLVDRMDHYLGHPKVDPHGDPIPSASGIMHKNRHTSLNDAVINTDLEVSRITRQDPEYLQYIHNTGLVPGKKVKIINKNAIADLLEISVKGVAKPVLIGGNSANTIMVTETPNNP